MTTHKGIKHNDRLSDREVREKLVARGAKALSDIELLSILLQEGRAEAGLTELAERVLNHTEGSLLKMAGMELRGLRMVEGLGLKRAATVMAALELGRRVAQEQGSAPKTVESNEDIVAMFRPQMMTLVHEEFWVVYLSSANTVIDRVKVGQGGVSGVVVDHRLVVKRAIEILASAMIVVHNHPSGVTEPSAEDRELTKRLKEAAALFDIVLLDHLIIGAGDSFSFRQAGIIE